MEKIKEYKQKTTLEESVEAAVKYCIKQGVLEQFLKDKGAEVYNMLTEEPSIEEIIDIRVKEEVEEIVEATVKAAVEAAVEKAEGRVEQKQHEIARNALAEGSTVDFVQKITGLTMETIESIQMSM